MTYTVHLGLRSDEWPRQITMTQTRGEAQRRAAAAVLAASEAHKSEVRLNGHLLDSYARRGAQSVRHTYEAKQRSMGSAS